MQLDVAAIFTRVRTVAGLETEHELGLDMGYESGGAAISAQKARKSPDIFAICKYLLEKRINTEPIPDLDLHWIITGKRTARIELCEKEVEALKCRLHDLEVENQTYLKLIRTFGTRLENTQSPVGATETESQRPVTRQEMREYVQGEVQKSKAKRNLPLPGTDMPISGAPLRNQQSPK